MRIKICGVSRPEDARAACEAGADAIGMVFAPGRRTVAMEAAIRIAGELPPWFPLVGVFRDQSESAVRAVLAQVPLTHLQFHGAEPRALVQAFDRPVIRAVPLCSAEDEADAHEWFALPLQILLDGATGGSGLPCDWDRAARFARERPVILAGGLTPANVAAAVRAVRPEAVDVSSGVESSPGIKDPRKIAAFIRQARGG